jgi:hypothetical protein
MWYERGGGDTCARNWAMLIIRKRKWIKIQNMDSIKEERWAERDKEKAGIRKEVREKEKGEKQEGRTGNMLGWGRHRKRKEEDKQTPGRMMAIKCKRTPKFKKMGKSGRKRMGRLSMERGRGNREKRERRDHSRIEGEEGPRGQGRFEVVVMLPFNWSSTLYWDTLKCAT